MKKISSFLISSLFIAQALAKESQFVNIGIVPQLSLQHKTIENSSNNINIGIASAEATNTYGLSFGTLYTNTTGKMYGLSLSPVHASAGTDMRGILIGIISTSINGGGAGFQFSALSNNSKGSMKGCQIAPIVNKNDKFKGFQLGLANINDTFTGFSLGLFSYNKTTKGFPFAAISISEDGKYNTQVSMEGSGLITFDMRLPGKNFYNVISLGYLPGEDYIFQYGFGLGVRTPYFFKLRIFSELDFCSYVEHRKQTEFYGGDDDYRSDGFLGVRSGVEYILNDKYIFMLGYKTDALTGTRPENAQDDGNNSKLCFGVGLQY